MILKYDCTVIFLKIQGNILVFQLLGRFLLIYYKIINILRRNYHNYVEYFIEMYVQVNVIKIEEYKTV